MLQFNNKRLCKLKETIQLYEREGISFVFLRLPNREVIKNEHFTVRPIIRGGGRSATSALTVKKHYPKAQRTLRIEFISQIFIKYPFQNLDEALTSIISILKLKILTKASLRILTKIQLCNLNQTSAAKYRPGLQLHNQQQCAQNLNKSLAF